MKDLDLNPEDHRIFSRPDIIITENVDPAIKIAPSTNTNIGPSTSTNTGTEWIVTKPLTSTDTNTDTEWVVEMKLGIGPIVNGGSSIGCNSSLINVNSGEQSNRAFERIKDEDSLSKDFTANLGGKIYYFAILEKANFFEAIQFCKKHGMELASLETEEENEIILDYMKTKLDKMDRFWISGNDLAKEKHFTWLSTGEPLTFTYWGISQPDDDVGDEDCVEIRNFGKLVWNDESCLLSQNFICESRDCIDCRRS